MVEKVVLSWSGGKDSALALHELKRCGRYQVISLLTTVALEYQRVSHHGVRVDLLERQAAALGLPLEKLYVPTQSSQTCRTDGDSEVFHAYEQLMKESMLRYKEAGVSTVAFGDIFLEDLRAYRENNLARLDMKGIFPIWKRDTRELARAFIDLGFKAILCYVDGLKLGEPFAGRAFDESLLADLPENVDPCGENGEYHTFVWDGPIFQEAVPVEVGIKVNREGRFYADLIPAGRAASALTRPG